MSNHELLHEAMRLGFQLPKALRRGLAEATVNCPRCHFALLERLHYTIEQQGADGAITASEIGQHMKVPAPAVSRSLKVLEQNGYITRTTDPTDRRKTWVRLTPKGEEVRLSYEGAARNFMDAVIDRIGEDAMRRLLADCQLLAQALTEETESRRAARGGAAAPPPEDCPHDFPPHGTPPGFEEE